MQALYSYVILGLITGICSGIFGVGGGIVMVPALVWFFHHSQHEAQGISLVAMLLPVGLLGAYQYHQKYNLPVKSSLMVALGIFVGAFVGAQIAGLISGKHLKIAFGIFMLGASLKLIFGK
ncbi:MAG: sulfite exporter TauE/SafE family protein [Bdellovibrionales bacterium]|nr:sulfite exporter TauE/SafE family protein [Bdellovibrionales bacterium]